MSDDWTAKPYAPWLEDIIQELVKSNPASIAMEMISENGLVATCYYNVSPNDRACMMDAMRDDAMEEWVRGNTDRIKAILDGEEVDDDELQINDEETDGDE